jgi:hypothetical protein
MTRTLIAIFAALGKRASIQGSEQMDKLDGYRLLIRMSLTSSELVHIMMMSIGTSDLQVTLLRQQRR